MMDVKQALRAAKGCVIYLTTANHPATISLPVAKYTIQRLIDNGWHGEDDNNVASWELCGSTLHVVFKT